MPQGRKSSFFFGRKKDSTADGNQKNEDKKTESNIEKAKKSMTTGNAPEQQQSGIGKLADDLTGTAFTVLQSVIKETTRPKSSLIYSIHPTTNSTEEPQKEVRPLENELKILQSSIALNMK